MGHVKNIDKLRDHARELVILTSKLYSTLEYLSDQNITTIKDNINLTCQITGLRVYTDLVAIEYDAIIGSEKTPESDH